MRLRISIRGRVRPSIRRSVRPYVPCYFRMTNMAIFDCEKSSYVIKTMIRWVTMKESHLMYPRGTCLIRLRLSIVYEGVSIRKSVRLHVRPLPSRENRRKRRFELRKPKWLHLLPLWTHRIARPGMLFYSWTGGCLRMNLFMSIPSERRSVAICLPSCEVTWIHGRIHVKTFGSIPAADGRTDPFPITSCLGVPSTCSSTEWARRKGVGSKPKMRRRVEVGYGTAKWNTSCSNLRTF